MACVASGILVAWLAGAPPALAQTPAKNGVKAPEPAGPGPEKRQFLGHEITPAPGLYLVKADLNVRAAPKTGSKKVGRFDEGARVRVAGLAKGAWLAVRDQGKDLGFAYAPVMIPLIEPPGPDPIEGRAKNALGDDCRYQITYDGQTPIEGQAFGSLDYQVDLVCGGNPAPLALSVPLFISEGPFGGGKRVRYLIGLDVMELAQGYDQVFSTTSFYEPARKEVRFDKLSVPRYGKTPKGPLAAADVSEALSGAVKLALAAWSAPVWAELVKARAAMISGEELPADGADPDSSEPPSLPLSRPGVRPENN